MDTVNSLKNSLNSMFAPHLSDKKAKKKKPEDSLFKKIMTVLNDAGDDLRQIYDAIANAVKNARIKDKFAKQIMKKANVLLVAGFTFVQRVRYISLFFIGLKLYFHYKYFTYKCLFHDGQQV